jgi:hypothetical protein
MWMQIATYLQKILTINEEAISVSEVRLLVSPRIMRKRQMR